MTCPECNNTGVIETGNNDFPCSCPAGDRAVFNVAGKGQMTGAEINQKPLLPPRTGLSRGKFVLTHYISSSDPAHGCSCCPQGLHASYQGMFHDPERDKRLDPIEFVKNAVADARIQDGDEFTMTISIKPTGRRPFGNRKFVLIEANVYGREKVNDQEK